MLKKQFAAEQDGLNPGDGALWGAVAHGGARAEVAARLLGDDYRQTYVDLARTQARVVKLPYTEPVASSGDAEPSASSTSIYLRSIREELPFAVQAYDTAIGCIGRIMGAAALGKFEAQSADKAVEGLVDSLERNPDALLCLPRLRQREFYTFAHCVNVAVLLAAFALHEGLPRHKVVVYGLAGFLHDLGKSLLPVSLLSACRDLSFEEQQLVSRHPMMGGNALAAAPNLEPEVLLAVLEHHERYDGSGYPKGISGDAISAMGHLTAIADTYDALCSRRPYREALYAHRTLAVMFRLSKKQFHPELLAKFIRMMGIYPIGSVVELQDGSRGVVTDGNRENPRLPQVTVVFDGEGRFAGGGKYTVFKAGAAEVSSCLAPEISGIDPAMLFGLRR